MSLNTKGFYTSNSSKVSTRDVFSQLKYDLLKSHTIIKQLIKRDLYSQFRQQFTGALWLVISPLVSVIGYIIMYSLGILKPGITSYPYFIFVVIGVGLWSLVAITTATLGNSLVGQGELILRTNIPLISIPFSGFGRLFLAYLSHLTSVFALILIFRVHLGPLWFLYPVAALLPLIYGISFGIVVSVWQVVSREVGSLFQVFLQICFFATPALFSANIQNQTLALILKFNPLSYTILTPRSFLLENSPIGLKGFLVSILLSLSSIIISFIFFYKKSYVVAERL